MAVLNFIQQFFPIDWYKFRMTKNVHSEFIETFSVQKDWKNLEWPKMGILNLFKPF